MKQIFISGASITYGVGGPNGGWADMIKQRFHQEMYASGSKEKVEVYNLARPGWIVQDVLDSLPSEVDARLHSETDVLVILSVGMNNAKAEGSSENFVSDAEGFEKEMRDLLSVAKQISSDVLFVGYTPVDESRTAPKISPFTGQRSYFFNDTIEKFDNLCSELCFELGVHHISVFDVINELGVNAFWSDGLHLNDDAHERVFEQVMPFVDEWISSR